MTRTVKSAGNVISFQITNSIPDTQGSPINLNPYLEKVEGYCAAAANSWLQYYDLNADPAPGATNFLREAEVFATDGFLWQYSTDNLWFPGLVNGLRVCLSTTQGLYTAPTGTDKCSFFISLSEWTINPLGLTAIGDITTDVDILQVWADASVTARTARIYRLEVAELGGVAAQFIGLFTQDNPALNAIPYTQLPLSVAANGHKVYDFGSLGLELQSRDTAGVLHNGLTITASTTTGVFDQLGTVAIRAYYK